MVAREAPDPSGPYRPGGCDRRRSVTNGPRGEPYFVFLDLRLPDVGTYRMSGIRATRGMPGLSRQAAGR